MLNYINNVSCKWEEDGGSLNSGKIKSCWCQCPKEHILFYAFHLPKLPDYYELLIKLPGVVTENEEGIGTPLDKELSDFLKEGLFIVVTNVVIVKIFDKTWKYLFCR